MRKHLRHLPESSPVLAGALLLVLGLYLSTAADQLGDWDGDAAHYILLGKSLAEGRGYVDLSSPGSYVHTKYPPFFPLLLAPLIRLWGVNLLVLRIEIIIIAVLSLAAWHRYYCSELDQKAALALVALLALNPYSFTFVTRTLSETPYLLLTGMVFYSFSRWRRGGRDRTLALALSAAVLAYFTRSAAVALFAAVAVATLACPGLRRRRLGRFPAVLVIWLVLALAFGAWSGFVVAHSSPARDYFYELTRNFYNGRGIDAAAVLGRLSGNLSYYYFQLPSELLPLPVQGRAAWAVVAALIWLILLGGAVAGLRRGQHIEALYAGFTAVMVLLWPAYLDVRFFYPLFPLFILFGYQALQSAAKYLGPRLTSAGWLIFAALMIDYSVHIGMIAKAQHTLNPYPPHTPLEMFGHRIEEPVIDWSETYYAFHTPRNMFALGEFIVLHRIAAQELAPGSVMASEEPRDTALLLGWPAVPLPITADPEAALEYLASWEVDYLIVDRYSAETGRFTVPLIRSRPGRFTQVVGDPGRLGPAIYRFDREQGPSPAPGG